MTTPTTTGFSFFNKNASEFAKLKGLVTFEGESTVRAASHSPEIVQNEMSQLAAAHLAELNGMMLGGSCTITGCSQNIAGLLNQSTKASKSRVI